MQAATRLRRVSAVGNLTPPSTPFIQSLGSVSGSTNGGLALTLTSPVTSGNSVLVVARGSGGVYVVSATDSKANIYTIDASTATTNTCAVIRGVITTPLGAGDTVTVTFSGSITAALVAAEYTALTPNAETTAIGTGTNSVTCPATGSLAVGGGLLVSAVTMAVAQTPAPSSGFTLHASAALGTAGLGLADMTVSVGSYTSSWSWTSAANSAACLVGYTS